MGALQLFQGITKPWRETLALPSRTDLYGYSTEYCRTRILPDYEFVILKWHQPPTVQPSIWKMKTLVLMSRHMKKHSLRSLPAWSVGLDNRRRTNQPSPEILGIITNSVLKDQPLHRCFVFQWKSGSSVELKLLLGQLSKTKY